MSRRAHGLGHVYKRGNVWWIQYRHRGKRYRESSDSTRKTDATKLLRRRLEEIGRGRLIGPDAEKLTFDDLTKMLVNDYKRRNLKSLHSRAMVSINRLREHFGHYHALDITTDAIDDYIARREQAGSTPATIQNELAALKRMFSLAVEADKLSHRPHVPRMQVDNVRTHFASEADFQAVHQGLPAEVQPVVAFLYLTGWRVGEALQLTWSDVEFDAGVVRLRPGSTKNNDARIFPFAALQEVEELLLRQREYTRVVEKATGNIVQHVFHRNGKTIRCFRRAWRAACVDAGLPHLWIHDLRRSAVRRLIRSGVPQAIAMKITGHKTPSTFRRYGIFTESDLTEAMQKVSAFRKTERAAERPVIPIGHSLATIPPQSATRAG